MDQYIGGIVHAILHLLYTRFFCKVMRDLGMVNHNEPVKRLFTQGLVLKGGTAMSKSKGNVVGAEDMAVKFGCDTGRLYTLFAAPPEKDLEWSEQAIEGCARFLQRVHKLVSRHAEWMNTARTSVAPGQEFAEASAKEKALLRKAHQVLRRVTHDFETRWHFNSAVALLMELVNEIHKAEPLEEGVRPEEARKVFELLTQMMAPMVPHLAEELVGDAWAHGGNAGAGGMAGVCGGAGGRRGSGNCCADERAGKGESFGRGRAGPGGAGGAGAGRCEDRETAGGAEDREDYCGAG